MVSVGLSAFLTILQDEQRSTYLRKCSVRAEQSVVHQYKVTIRQREYAVPMTGQPEGDIDSERSTVKCACSCYLISFWSTKQPPPPPQWSLWHEGETEDNVDMKLTFSQGHISWLLSNFQRTVCKSEIPIWRPLPWFGQRTN